MQKYIYVFFLLFLFSFKASAQDPQYSQFYAAPLFMSPAFAGSGHSSRLVANYRNQWPRMQAKYVTYSASADHYFDKYNSGVGLVISNDRQGYGNLISTDIGLQYAYELELTSKWAFRAGLQGSLVQRGIDYYGFTFGNQFNDETGFDPSVSHGENFDNSRVSYADFSTGGLLYSNNFYIGYSAHHITRPAQSFMTVGESKLPMKSTVIAGYKFILDYKGKKGLVRGANDREISFSPALLYKKQGPFDQLDAGLYFTYEPIFFGTWYRGLPIKSFTPGIFNQDALIFVLGYSTNGLMVGYSYDVTISRLTPSTGGAHEISVAFEFGGSNYKKRLGRRSRSLPCPKF